MEVATQNDFNHESLLDENKSDNADITNNYKIDNAEQSPARREICEWQHIDPDTGVVMKARLEADRWVDGSLKSYGKISDSQNISQPNGTQLLQRKQLEVLQARTINGAMQVVRTETVQSSSSRGLPSPSIMSAIFDKSIDGSVSGNKNHLCKHSSYINSNSYSLVPHKNVFPFQFTLEQNCKINNVKNTQSIFSNTINEKIRHQNSIVFSENDNPKHNIYQCTNSKNVSKNAMLSDMRPSKKLNKLMESSSSISNLTSTKSNTSNALIKSTHCTMCPQNVSLQAIEKDNRKNKFSKSSVPSSLSTTLAATRTKTSTTENSAAPTQSRQLICRLYKQPSFYGNNNSSAETCVGVHNCDADIDVSANGAMRVAKASPVAMPRERHQHYTVNPKEQQQKFQKRNEVTPTQLNRQSRQNLESFRHYNDYDNMSPANSNDDDDLRIIQERQTYIDNGHKRLQRSHSISTDDLNAECNKMNHGDEKVNEWQRVSRLRRSFQSASSGCNTQCTMQIVKRPTDLPVNSISVSKICANLENGQRLNTAVRNTSADLLALNSILNEPKDMKSNIAKSETVLTAKSLNEIRNNLKRLSNEALYKDDFITFKQLPSEEEQIKVPEIQQLSGDDFYQRRTQKTCISRVSSSDLTPFYNEESNEKLVEEFNNNRLQKLTYPHKNLYTTNSLEPRRKTKENASIDWHLRRKSYGFEKMSTVVDNSMSGIDYSTDSGLGHSSEISNCASIETVKPRRGMVIHFGDSLNLNNNQNKIKHNCTSGNDINKLQKRHSIAVDEYVGENLNKSTQVQISEMDKVPVLYSKSLINVEKNYNSVYKGVFQRSVQQKRVEFCKTEVHFGAESGRVNIVETDGKPPPTNNFRRRRRTVNGPLQSLVHSPSLNDDNVNCNEHINSSTITSLTRFGNETNNTQIFDEPDLMKKANVTVSVSQLDLINNPSKCYTSANGDDTTDLDNEELSNIRGILKNKLKKPKPYHLGENIKHTDVLWGAQKNEETTDELYELKNLQKNNTEYNSKNISGSKVHSTKINLSTNDTFKGFTNAGFLYYVQGSNHHQLNTDEGLKSTSLIIKTIRSAKEFDKAMQRLNIASVKADVIPPVVVPSTISFSPNSQCSINNLSNNQMRSLLELENPKLNSMTNSNDLKYIAKKAQSKVSQKNLLDLIETTKLPINNKILYIKQLNELPAVYQADGESTDDEVESYFSEHRYCRDKSKTTNINCAPEMKAFIKNPHKLDGLNMNNKVDYMSSNEISYKNIRNQTDLIDSNVMSIKLHSPQDYLCKTETLPLTHSYSFSEKPQRNSCNSPAEDIRIIKPVPEQLKIIKETRGARKLRQHELSYFGVPIEKSVPIRGIRDMKTTNTHSTSPSRKQKTFFYPQENDLNKNDFINNGQSINNKPDLLRHGKSEKLFSKNCFEEKYSFNRRNSQQPQPFDNTNIKNFDEHLYENISNELTQIFKIKSDNKTDYDRKTDLSRDENILKEMANDADQTLKSLSDEDQIEKRHSSHRRNLQPLQTISEKIVTKIIHDKCIAVKMPSNKTSFGEKINVDNSKKLVNSNVNRSRTSSLSSVESSTRSRSHSLSSDHEYENINLRSKKNIRVKKQNCSSPSYSEPLSLTTGDKSNENNIKGACSKSNYKKSLKISKDHKLESEQHSKLRSENKVIPKSPKSISYNSGSKKIECSTVDNTKGSHHKSYEQYQKHLKKNKSESSKCIDGKNLDLNCKYKSNQCSTLTSHINLTEIKQDRHKQIPDSNLAISSSSDKVITQDSFNKAGKEKLNSLNLKDQTSRLNQHHSTATIMSNKTRERKNAIPITSLQPTKCNEKKLHEKLPTYSKNVEQIGSGRRNHPEIMRTKPQHIQHNLTTATIVGKTRDRHRK